MFTNASWQLQRLVKNWIRFEIAPLLIWVTSHLTNFSARLKVNTSLAIWFNRINSTLNSITNSIQIAKNYISSHFPLPGQSLSMLLYCNRSMLLSYAHLSMVCVWILNRYISTAKYLIRMNVECGLLCDGCYSRIIQLILLLILLENIYLNIEWIPFEF